MASNSSANSAPSSSQSPSNSLAFVVNPLPSTDDQLNERILDAADKIRYRSGNNSFSSNLPILNFYNNSASATNNNNASNNSGPNQPQTSSSSSSNASNNQSLLLPPPPPPQTDLSLEQSPGRVNVSQCVISRKYVAVLLEDSRVCRFRYSIHPDRLSNPTAPIDHNAAANKRCLNNSPSSGALATGTSQSSSQRALSTRRRLIRSSTRPRTSASVIMGRSHVIPAQYVPEELVNQAQVVLQGKSRNIIIRELQRTNLDVNLAVNNLLSRDDEDFDDADDGQEQMIQSSDDLVSLLESGLQNDHSVIIDSDFADEVFSYPLRIRSGSTIFNGSSSASGNNAAGGSGASNSSSGGGSRPSRLRDDTFSFLERDLQFASSVSGSKNRVYYSVGDPKSDLNNLCNSNALRQKKSSDSVQLAPMSFTDQQEFWPGGQDKKFVAIASIYNELIAITAQGQLCQWRWQDAEPFKAQHHDGTVYYHPKVPSLGLLTEKITLLSASCIRATVATESGKLATWIDESIAPIAAPKLEHAATNSIFTDAMTSCSGSSKIAALYVSSLMSVVQLSSGTLFWWGIPPFSHRKKLVEKVKNDRSKSKSSKSSGGSSPSSSTILKDNEIVLGSIVCMRNSPIYQNGAIAFTTVGGEPKVGQLVNSAWKITDSCAFRVLSQQEIHYRSISRSISNVGQQLAKDYSINSSAAAGTSAESSGAGQSQSNIKASEMTRNEMPPPPSPASSTSSEPSYNPPLLKRSKARNSSGSSQNQSGSSNIAANNQDREQQSLNAIERIENWNLKDVVFMEDVKSMPIGRIVKVDGVFVAVKFNHLSTNNTAGNELNQSNQQQSRTSGTGDSSLENYLQEIRLLRKADLIILKSTPSSGFGGAGQLLSNSSSISLGKAYDCLQRYPKRIHVPEHVQILAMTLTNLGLHAIAKIGGYRFSYILINIMTGRIEQDAKISIECSTFFGNCANPKSSLIRLYSAGESDTTTVVVCRDGNGTLYPLAKDCTETVIREPISLNLGPVSNVALGVFALPNQINIPVTTNSSTSLNSSGNSANVPKTHAAILGLAFESQYLMSSILKSDLDLLRERLSLLERFPHIYHSMINEICDGNHNIIHIAVTSCFPTSNNKHSLIEMNISHILEIDEAIPMDRNSSINDSFNSSQSNENSSDAPNSQSQKGVHFDSSSGTSEPLLDPNEQKPIAHSILWTLLDSPLLAPYLFDLLSARDFQGHTPFMLAVAGRAYSAANQLFIVMQRVARHYATTNSTFASTTPAYQDLYQRTFMQMLYPRGSLPDHSPLYMLCSNDTCSFTWTGEEHINQDIFECRTCGLVGSLCCCTECARVCHRGHDCKLKRTSPTAYCDCWEKCKCKALISGCQPARYLLLKRILSSTDLSIRVNSRGEHILLFLVQTVGRQIVEQKQYRPSRLRNSSSSRNKAPTDAASDEHTNVPEHDLEPPKFSRRALEKLLCDWPTVKSMILIGYRAPENTVSKRRNYLCTFFNGTSNAYANEEENAYLARQNGSALLDKFTHLLLRIGLDMVERLIMTILTACKSSVESRVVARRFVRSVARVGLVICFELNPTLYANIPNQNVLFYTLIDRALGTNSTFNTNGSSSGSSSSSSKKNSAISMLSKCRRIFLSFLPIAVEELSEITESLIAPVKLGVARPSAPFALSPNNNEAMASVDDIFAVDTSIYAHQSDFLDSSFGLDILEEPPSAQENLAPNISEFSYENPPLAAVNELLAAGSAASSGGAVASSDVSLSRNNNESDIRMDTTPAPNVFDHSVPSTSGNDLMSQANVVLGSVPSTSGSTSNSSSNTQPLNSGEAVPASVSAMDDSYHRHHDDIVIIGEMLGGSEQDEDNSNVGGRDTESDSESNPDDASYLSNADNASAQRSVVTGATAGSDVGVASLPYDDESINSNVDDVDVDDDEDDDAEGEENDDDDEDEDDASDAAETEPETEEISAFIDEALERPSNNASGNFSSSSAANNNNTNTSRSNILQHVQWALRGQRESIANTNASTAQDTSFRRTAVANTLSSGENTISMSNSAIGLSRAFSIIIRQIADLLPLLRDPSELSTSGIHYLSFTPAEAASIQQAIEERLRNTWNWLITIMDSTETQLRFGCALSNRRVTSTLSSPMTTSATTSAAIPSVSFSSNTTSNRFNRLRAFQNHDDMLFLPTLSRTTSSLRRMAGLFGRSSGSSSGVANAAGSSAVGSTTVPANAAVASSSGLSLDSSASRRDFLTYTMSLMRSHSNEQYDSLPVLDVASLKHVAYVFDSFVYYIRRGLVIPFESTTNYSSLVDDISELNFDFYQTAPIPAPGALFMENVDSEMPSANEEKSPATNYEPNVGRNHGFFRRSNSTLYLGCPPPDPFSAPFHEALPLASKPHLLQPNARREQLFGIPRPSNLTQAEEMIKSLPSQLSLTKRQTPQHPGSSQSNKGSYGSSSQGYTTPTTPQRNQSVIIQQQSVTPTTPTKPSVIVLAGSAKHHSQTGDQQQLHPNSSFSSKNSSNNNGQNILQSTTSSSNNDLGQSDKLIYFGNQQQHDFLLGRWRLSLELFGRLFVEDVGLEPSSIITELSGFPIKESRFRREIERLRISSTSTSFTSNSNSQRDISFLKLDRDRGVLLQQTFKELNSVFNTHTRRLSSNTTLSSQTVAISRVKVTFKDEPGEGSGVARSFYTAFSEAVLANEKLPALDWLISSSSSTGGVSSGAGAASGRNSGTFSLTPYNFQYNLIHVTRGGVTPPTSNANSTTSQSNHYAMRSVDDTISHLRRPRSPGRLRLFTPRRTQPIERAVTIRNEFRSSSSSNNNANNAGSNNSGGGNLNSGQSSSSSLPASSSRSSRSSGPLLRYDSAPFVPTQFLNFANRFTPPLIPADSRTTLGNRIYSRVYPLQPNRAAKITGMFLDLPSHDLIPILTSDEEFRIQLEQAVEIINMNESTPQRQSNNNASSSVAASSGNSSASQIASAPIDDQQQHSFQMESNLLDISANTSSGKISSAHFKSAESLVQSDLPEEEDNEPLFYQPGPRGFYSPRSGRCSEARLNAFRNVGRIIGICFVQNELCPITFNRHVIKIILGRPVSWHDLAFFDSDLYESLRQMILDAESSNKDEIFAQLDFNFVIDLGPEEGGHEIELIPNGRNIHVTPQNVYDYVRRYALYRMFDSQLASIQAIRAGIFDVLPAKTFDGLTAEDFRLLLNGVNEINIQLLQSYVTFHDESGDGSEHLSYFRRWFWWVVERMTNEEKQDLIYFWTGSPALPASEEGFQPMPSITIRPRDDCYFVTANTCISRLYIPLYSSRTILRQKLLVSIKSKSFGFI